MMTMTMISMKVATAFVLLFLSCLMEFSWAAQGLELAPFSAVEKEDINPFCTAPTVDDTFYALIVDGASSGSRIRVYSWNGRDGDISEILPSEETEDDFETEPGLSSYAPSGVGAGESLSKLIDAAKTLIPEEVWSKVPLNVFCTAGVRVLEPESFQLAVLDNTREYLSDPINNPFMLQSVSIITGEEEGAYGYISINNGNGRPSDQWDGVLDMGGASTQHTFRPKNLLANQVSFVNIKDGLNQVYGQSYPRFGKDEARDRYLNGVVEAGSTEPYLANCFAPNYSAEFTTAAGETVTIKGVGDGAACAEEIESMLFKGYYCGLGPCGIQGRYVPLINKDIGYVAVSANYFGARNLGLIDGDVGTLTAPDYLEAAIQFCGEDLPADANRFIAQNCFDTVWGAKVILSYGFDEETEITFARRLDGRTADWTLGSLINLRAISLLSCDDDNDNPCNITDKNTCKKTCGCHWDNSELACMEGRSTKTRGGNGGKRG